MPKPKKSSKPSPKSAVKVEDLEPQTNPRAGVSRSQTLKDDDQKIALEFGQMKAGDTGL